MNQPGRLIQLRISGMRVIDDLTLDLDGLTVLIGDNGTGIEYLSEGQLSYLAMLALYELSEQSSIVVFDEPEVHLHPTLLARVVMLLESLAKNTPVMLSTHSDQLLDCLSRPAASVVLLRSGRARRDAFAAAQRGSPRAIAQRLSRCRKRSRRREY